MTINENAYLVLKALLSGPSYGYAIRKHILDLTGGQQNLLEDGMVEKAGEKVIDGRVRRTFRINGLRERALAEKERMLRRTFSGGVAEELSGTQGAWRWRSEPIVN